jgi:AcrR family transcriptional regulator
VTTPTSTPGLRERKKARTRAAIQSEALRLFREQGYDATTIDQIADAAEFSPSTFFRYFPSKEDVVMYDDLDPAMIAAYRAQPPDVSPIAALRAAMRTVFTDLPADQLRDMGDRFNLMRGVPELRNRMLSEFVRNIDLGAELLAERLQRSASDRQVRIVAGALIGALMAILFDADAAEPMDYLRLMDETLETIESSLRL